MVSSDSSRRAVSLLVILFIGVAIASSLLVQAAAFQGAQDPLQDVIEEVGGELALEEHAHYGNIFYGQVLAVLREEQEKWGPDDLPNQIIYYRVSTEETLRGKVTGEIDIMYLGADSMSPESLGFGPLQVGERYLFSAGTITEDNAYPVNAGTGTILVQNEEVEAALLAEFARLIPLAEAEEREAIEQVTAEAGERQRNE